MSEEEALLRAICIEPEDDTPRLVYADWLDENGQPERASFIRFQIQFARALPPRVLEPKPSAREQEQLKQLKQHAKAWFKPPARWMLDDHYLVRRGFPYAVSCNYKEYHNNQHAFARWPITRFHPLLYANDTEQARHFAETPLPENIRELDLYYSSIGPDPLRILLQALTKPQNRLEIGGDQRFC
jgi:uncharacterized protein (TIGR02996 family)